MARARRRSPSRVTIRVLGPLTEDVVVSAGYAAGTGTVYGVTAAQRAVAGYASGTGAANAPTIDSGSELTIQGYGANALATLGGDDYEVTSSSSGTGSGTFRDALAWLNSGNEGTIWFSGAAIGATITMPSSVTTISNADNFIIDGRGANFTIDGGCIKFSNCTGFAIVNIRHRGGWNGGQDADNFTNTGCSDFAYVNVSTSGSYDEGISSTNGCENYTLQDCLLTEGADYVEDEEGHNYASLNYGYTADTNGPGSFIRNAFINKYYRNPKLGFHNDGNTTPDTRDITYDVVNNIVVNSNYGLSAELGAKVNNTNPYQQDSQYGDVEWGGDIGTYTVATYAQVTAMTANDAAAYAVDNAGCLPHDSWDSTRLAQISV